MQKSPGVIHFTQRALEEKAGMSVMGRTRSFTNDAVRPCAVGYRSRAYDRIRTESGRNI